MQRIYQKKLVRKLAMGLLLSALIPIATAHAQATDYAPVGFGVLLGEPTGLTMKVWTNHSDAVSFELGDSYFGLPRLEIDYEMHSGENRSSVRFYAGPGLAIGFNSGGRTFIFGSDGSGLYRNGNDNNIAIGGRVVFGISLLPRPFELFMEGGPLFGFSPGFGAALDFAIGMRFYP